MKRKNNNLARVAEMEDCTVNFACLLSRSQWHNDDQLQPNPVIIGRSSG